MFGLRLSFLFALLLWSIVSSYYLWFQPEQSMERLIEAYSKKQRSILSNREFAIWMFKSGIGIWILYDDGAWKKIHSLSPETIAIGDLDDNGEDDCIMDFGSGVGIWVLYNNATWTKLHSLSPEIIVTGNLK